MMNVRDGSDVHLFMRQRPSSWTQLKLLARYSAGHPVREHT